MTQVFTERGTVVAVTVLEAGPCRVVQRKTTTVDGYSAVQIGFGERAARRTPKPLVGHFRKKFPKPAAQPGRPFEARRVECGFKCPGQILWPGWLFWICVYGPDQPGSFLNL